MEFSERLKILMDDKGIAQRQLAMELGCDPSCVHSWLTGYNLPSTKSLSKLCDIFDTTPNELLAYNEKSEVAFTIHSLQSKMEKLNDDLTVICEQILYVQKQLKKLKGE